MGVALSGATQGSQGPFSQHRARPELPPTLPRRVESIAQPGLGNPLHLLCGCHVWEKIQPLVCRQGWNILGFLL